MIGDSGKVEIECWCRFINGSCRVQVKVGGGDNS